LGANDALGDGGGGDEECAGDLLGRQSAQQAQREGDAGFGRQHWMAGREHQPQQIVTNVVVHGSSEIRLRHLALSFMAEFFELALETLVASHTIDGAMLGGGHQPGAWVVRNAGAWPLFERGDESVLGKFFGHTNIAHDSRQAGDKPCRLNSPDCVNRTMGVGSVHSFRSNQLHSADASRAASTEIYDPFCPAWACISAKPAAACCTSAGKSSSS
jgi:hypothetical protein